MAMVPGKCPVCGAIIKVNDEKEEGFCNQCGGKIYVQQSIQILKELGSDMPQPKQEPIQPQEPKHAQRISPEQQIRTMFQFCNSEQDFMGLRANVMSMPCDDNEKAALLAELDRAMRRRLADELDKEKNYNESQESPMNLVIGCVLIAAIGFAVNFFMHKTWPGIVGLVLGVLGIFGGMMERKDIKKVSDNKAAAELLAEYRRLGYKL